MAKDKIYDKEIHFKINKTIWSSFEKMAYDEKITSSELLRKIISEYIKK